MERGQWSGLSIISRDSKSFHQRTLLIILISFEISTPDQRDREPHFVSRNFLEFRIGSNYPKPKYIYLICILEKEEKQKYIIFVLVLPSYLHGCFCFLWSSEFWGRMEKERNPLGQWGLFLEFFSPHKPLSLLLQNYFQETCSEHSEYFLWMLYAKKTKKQTQCFMCPLW